MGVQRLWTVSLPARLSNVVAIAPGGGFASFEGAYSLALLDGCGIVPWGLCYEGQTTIPSDLTHALAVAAGPYHCVALRDDGQVTAWGSNSSGQTIVPVGLTNVVAISGGASNSLALTQDGRVVAWGGNDDGQAAPPTGLTDVLAVAAGATHSLAPVQEAPELSIALESPTSLVVTWPAAAHSWILQRANSPFATGWLDVPDVPETNGILHRVNISSGQDREFFRLFKP